jgi:hypothetical protein
MGRKIVQIVTGLAPETMEWGIMLITLARALHAHEELKVSLWWEPGVAGSSATVEGFQAVMVAERRPEHLVSSLDRILGQCGAASDTPVLLHCSLYGYARRALAFWLLGELKLGTKRAGLQVVDHVHDWRLRDLGGPAHFG